MIVTVSVIDIDEFDAKISHLNLVNYTDGMALYYEALDYPPSKEQAKARLLNLAKNKLQQGDII